MRRDEFTTLPLPIALGLIYDVASQRLRDMPMPDVPRPPRFDGRLGKKGGYVWMSEMTLGDLEWWHKNKTERAAQGGQYADRDAKTAATLSHWITWRTIAPSEVWSGTRGEDRVTAAPPSREPRVHQWENSGRGKGGASQSRSKEDYADEYDD